MTSTSYVAIVTYIWNTEYYFREIYFIFSIYNLKNTNFLQTYDMKNCNFYFNIPNISDVAFKYAIYQIKVYNIRKIKGFEMNVCVGCWRKQETTRLGEFNYLMILMHNILDCYNNCLISIVSHKAYKVFIL